MASCGARQLTLNPQVLDGRRLPTLRRLGAHLRPRLGALIGRVTDAIIRGQAAEMLALASGCTVPRTDHSAVGWLDGRDARRVPPNAWPSLSLRASPTAGPGIGIGRSGTRHLSRTVARHDQEETRSCFVISGLVGGNDYSGGRRNTVGETQLHLYTDWEKPPSSTEH